MAHQIEEKKDNKMNILPRELIKNQALAMAFACVRCGGVPISCMNDKDGKILCNKCAKDAVDSISNPTVQNMIESLKMKCLTILDCKSGTEKNSGWDVSNEGHIISTNIKHDICEWEGKISEYDQHSKHCQYQMILCHLCKTFKCARKDLNGHVAECPSASIDCPLWGQSILRKDNEGHLNESCPNEDCKEEIKRDLVGDFAECCDISRQCPLQYVAESPSASIDCPLYGQCILSKNKEEHLNESSFSNEDCKENREDFMVDECLEISMQKLLLCSNEDCPEEIKSEDYKVHVEEECKYRVIDCEYKKYGCNVDGIRYIDIEKHMDEYKLDHMANKFDFICSNSIQQNEIIAQLGETNNNLKIQNEGLIRTVNELRASINTLKSRQSEMTNQVIPKGCVVIWKKEFIYENDFDKNGIIYNLGDKNQETKEWINPYKLKKIELQSTGMGYGNIDNLIGRNAGVYCYLDRRKNAWFSIQFKTIKIKPRKYTLRHVNQNNFYLRNWRFEASLDGQNWMILKNHCNDYRLNNKDATHTWNIDNCKQFYFTYFRIYMTGKNSNHAWVLNCSGFEIYGDVCNNVVDFEPVPSVCYVS